MTETEAKRSDKVRLAVLQAERVRAKLLATVDELEAFVALLWEEIESQYPEEGPKSGE